MLSDLIATTWRMQEMPEAVELAQKPWFGIIQQNAAGGCSKGCGGE